VGIIRYLQVAIVDLKSGNPTTVLLKDRFIQLCIASRIITFLTKNVVDKKKSIDYKECFPTETITNWLILQMKDIIINSN